MTSTPHFTGQSEIIKRELDSAKTSIIVAVAGLSDPKLFNALVQADKRGVSVRVALLDVDYNRRAKWELKDGHRYWIPKSKKGSGSLHYKFCVIDFGTVISGSYNWTGNCQCSCRLDG